MAVYAGAGKSGILIDGEWKSIERESPQPTKGRDMASPSARHATV